jgi:hypothetical protein
MYNEQYKQSPLEAMRHPFGFQQHGYAQGGKSYGEQGDFMVEISEMAHGRKPIPEELKAVICAVTREETDRMIEQYGYTQSAHESGHDSERHRRYKKTLEELREITSVTEAVKRAEQYFNNLTDDHKKVLHQILNRPSYKRMAQMVNMSPERFMELNSELESIYKL